MDSVCRRGFLGCPPIFSGRESGGNIITINSPVTYDWLFFCFFDPWIPVPLFIQLRGTPNIFINNKAVYSSFRCVKNSQHEQMKMLGWQFSLPWWCRPLSLGVQWTHTTTVPISGSPLRSCLCAKTFARGELVELIHAAAVATATLPSLRAIRLL
jgi:hypothetical protein